MATAPPKPMGDPPFQPSSPPVGREVTLTAKQIQPPSPLYIQPEDTFYFQINAPTGAGNYVCNLSIRFLRPDGEISTTLKTVPIVGTLAFIVFSLGEGFLLSAAVANLANGSAEPGAVFVQLYVLRDLPQASLVVWTILDDYVTSGHIPSWPYGRQIFAQEGPGRIRSITGTTPGAGSEINEVVPPNVRWSLIAFFFKLVTGAAVANRFPRVTLDDGANVYFNSGQPTAQVASTTDTYSATPGLPNGNDAGGVGIIALPQPLYLAAGHHVRTVTQNIQAADQYTAPQYLVQEWVSA
jgi:hypothetical protein